MLDYWSIAVRCSLTIEMLGGSDVDLLRDLWVRATSERCRAAHIPVYAAAVIVKRKGRSMTPIVRATI